MDLIPGELAEELERRLAEYNIHVNGGLSQVNYSSVERVDLDVDGRILSVAALYLPHISATEALHAAHAAAIDLPLFVVGHRIHASSAETLRTQGIWYIDEAGNAFLRVSGLIFLDVRGRRNSGSREEARPRVGPSNPFTPKRAQVVLAILTMPSLADAPLREIAFRSGVSVGMAKETLDTLEVTGFIEQTVSQRRLIRRSVLIDLWASAYPGGLGRSNLLMVAGGDVDGWSLPHDMEFAVSGEQAVRGSISHPQSLVLYVHSEGKKAPPRDLMIANRWYREPHGNIILRDLFWRGLSGVTEDGTAPLLLVYADLLAAHEPRQAEVAREMRKDLERMVTD